MRAAHVLALGALGLVGCDLTDAPVTAGVTRNTDTRAAGGAPIAPYDECLVTTYEEVSRGAEHTELCVPLAAPLHPPATGPHYPLWADFRTYASPIPSGYLLHAMEHGAVLLLHNCPRGCEDVREAFAELVAAHPVDDACPDGVKRFIIAPDPDLDVPVAAVAWGHVYLATCLDRASLEDFIGEHYARAPEDHCASGVDRSLDGWCPAAE